IGDGGVVADIEDLLPELAAVGGLVETAVAAGRPERPLGGDIDNVAVARIDDDLADVLRPREADVLPRLAAIVGAVDAVAVADAALTIVLARADPDGVGVLRIEGDGADGVGALAIEDGVPGGAGVGGLPDAARGDGDVPGGAVLRVDGERRDATRRDRRPDG